MSKKHAGYVYIPVKPETRTALIKLKRYGDTYDTIIKLLVAESVLNRIEDHAAQNIDHKDGDDEERGA